MRALLREEGYPVVVAKSGTEAQERALRMRPALVLVAVEATDDAALQTIAELRERPGLGRRLTILAMAKEEDHPSCLEAGADGCLKAPLELEALATLIGQLTGQAP